MTQPLSLMAVTALSVARSTIDAEEPIAPEV